MKRVVAAFVSLSVTVALLSSTTGSVAGASPVAAKACKPTKKKKCPAPKPKAPRAPAPAVGDPLGLIEIERGIRKHTLGPDKFGVFFCDDPSQPTDHAAVMSQLNKDVVPFYTWLSEGKYQPTFVEAGTGVPDPALDFDICFPAFASLPSAAKYNAGILVMNAVGGNGFGQTGTGDENFPWNMRYISIGQRHLLREAIAIPHEVGHTLHFPHSFADSATGIYAQYSNPIDMMSGSPLSFADSDQQPASATVAINRYQAGWLDPKQVAVHASTSGSYALGPIGSPGTQMVVIPSGSAHAFTTLETRVKESFDAVIDKEGVAVHLVDQRCVECVGVNSRTAPAGAPYTVDHVLGVGESMMLGTTRVEVISRTGNEFVVSVTGATYPFVALSPIPRT
jgi:hypothetical protein